MSKTIYNQSPLPFQGQKRRFQKQFKQCLHELQADATFVDLFGGSGLLSRFVKDVLPDARVIYNDFDDYSARIRNIPATNALLADLREMLSDHPEDKIITEPLHSRIIDRIQSEAGDVDCITLSSNLLFSMNYATSRDDFRNKTLYNSIRKTDYPEALDYLTGLEVVRMDYRALYQLHRHTPGVVFLIDPPYLSTDVSTYQNYWALSDYLDVLDLLNGVSFFYFTSNKSNILELTAWIARAHGVPDPFANGRVFKTSNNPSPNSKFTDIMIFKHK